MDFDQGPTISQGSFLIHGGMRLNHVVNKKIKAGSKRAVANPAQCNSRLPILSEGERHRVLVEWNATRTEYPRHACVHELFEEQARLRQNALAVRFDRARLSYGRLNEQANLVAHRLIKMGVKPGALIALCPERSLEMVVAILGILKSGAAYAPLDPTLPKQRLAGMLKDLGSPALVLTHTRLADSLPKFAEPALALDTADLSAEPATNPRVQITPDALAYVSFTSGSTGQPKGVRVPHRGIVRLVRNTNYASFEPSDVFLQFAPLAFDASTFEIWGALLNGATLALMPPQLPSLAELADVMRRHRVTVAWFTSGLFNQIVDEKPEALQGLRQLLAGGDVLSPAHVVKALAIIGSGALINGYGPTENTTFTACYRVANTFDGRDPVPIGRPVSNTTCYVLDENLQPVPIGVPGELYTGGDGLADGYLRDPQLTAEKFIPHPFQPGERLYRTGDIVRWLADGQLEFIGRNNDQVKVRGFRVELGEIEAALLQHPAIRQCAVVARPDANGAKQIVAYIVPRATPAPGLEPLRAFLADRIPDFMLPSFVVVLNELPLSRNGKVHRAALPAPEPRSAVEQVVTPRDELESQLQAIWQQVLNIKPIGVHDGFFALGGHSLLATRLISMVEENFGRQLKVAALFQQPTIAGLAAVLRDGARVPASSIVEIQPHGSRQPLFLVHGVGGGMFWGYSNLARHLCTDQPVFGFKSRGLEGEDEPQSIEALAASYLSDLGTFQPRGPYRLGGYCFGGLVAYEMARQLTAQGDAVEFLGLMNSSAPNSSYAQFSWTPRSSVQFGTNVLRRFYYSARAHPTKMPRFLMWKIRSLIKARLHKIAQSPNSTKESQNDVDVGVDLSGYNETGRRVWRTHYNAAANYCPQPYPGQVWLFCSPVHPLRCSFDPDYGWSKFASGGLTTKIIGSAHEAILEEPAVRAVAANMRPYLS